MRSEGLKRDGERGGEKRASGTGNVRERGVKKKGIGKETGGCDGERREGVDGIGGGEEGRGAGSWCLWRQVLISNKMPAMRSLFPHVQIDVM